MFNELLQTNYKRQELKICLFRTTIECFKQPMEINLQMIHREPIKINDNSQYFDFIGGTLKYVTYVMS